ncbi:hypothetical protein ACS0TY_017420 [Phlomoides rotata]
MEQMMKDLVEDEHQLGRIKDWISSYHLDTVELIDILSNFPDISVVLIEGTSEGSYMKSFPGRREYIIYVDQVGLYSDHSYARSMDQFTASLGSVAWKVASNKIEQALPQGFKFG